MHTMLQQNYEEDVNWILSAKAGHNNFWVIFEDIASNLFQSTAILAIQSKRQLETIAAS